MNPPFAALLPIEGRILYFEHVPLFPFCLENYSPDDTSESVSDTASGEVASE